jgi:predicted AlkP superfamily pyrophosphatase or phosphodiesterase
MDGTDARLVTWFTTERKDRMERKRALLFTVDGMRPDALEAKRAPHMKRLWREGACTGAARAVMPSVTLPCFMSMLRGVEPARHGVTTNIYQPPARPVPSLFDVAKEQGRLAGFFYNWEELRDLAAPGSLDVSLMYGDCESPEGDRHVAELAAAYLARVDFDLLMIYLGWPDACAHLHGWMSEPYLESIANADECLGLLLSTLEKLGRAQETVTLVTSDHGGHERSHGTDMDEDILVPWVLHGPGVRAGHTLDGAVRIYDTCVTLAHVLGLKPSREWEGRVVEEALDGTPPG